MDFNKLLFPHNKPRESQNDMILKVEDVIREKNNLLVHAPTGLGKTAAVLAPALTYALEHDKVVFFLTSRHTQHKIALDTLSKIKEKHDKDFITVSIVGKKGLCLQPGVQTLYSSEFHEYCKALREDKKCEFYENMRKKDKISPSTSAAVDDLSKLRLVTTDASLEISQKYKICPYELSILMAKKARVIIGDYFYMFNPGISSLFFNKIERNLEDCIIIIDEAHNIPDRVKDLFTNRLSNIIVRRAISEANKYKFKELAEALVKIEVILDELSDFEGEERYVKKTDFIDRINEFTDYMELMEQLSDVADEVRSSQKQSYIGSVALFLEMWPGRDDGFTRIISKHESSRESMIVLSYRCLDPSLATKKVIEEAHATIWMSGTLTPTSMYKELLGFDECEESKYSSPFPEENQLNLIVPKTSTKYELRNIKQFKDIADILAKIVNVVPGNSAVFFPSYFLRDTIYKNFIHLCNKTIFIEHASMTKNEKHELLEKFKSYKDQGAVLLGVISGSFGEGIDLPGDYLKGVVIVGLPLTKPDLESKALIDYYDRKFAKGWDYGYLFPAFNKALQSAGRCIRTEKDKGIIVFLDERYTCTNYRRCFPDSWSIKTTLLYESIIKDFFNKKK